MLTTLRAHCNTTALKDKRRARNEYVKTGNHGPSSVTPTTPNPNLSLNSVERPTRQTPRAFYLDALS